MNMIEIIQPLIENNYTMEEEIQGLSPQDIEQVERQFDVTLPRAYREFLLTMGHRAGPIFRGTDLLYPHRFNLREAAIELLKEVKSDFQLPDRAFVFSMHQGYIFEYFILDEGDDPPVYSFYEIEPEPKVIASSFSEYLKNYVAAYLAGRNSWRGKKED